MNIRVETKINNLQLEAMRKCSDRLKKKKENDNNYCPPTYGVTSRLKNKYL